MVETRGCSFGLYFLFALYGGTAIQNARPRIFRRLISSNAGEKGGKAGEQIPVVTTVDYFLQQ